MVPLGILLALAASTPRYDTVKTLKTLEINDAYDEMQDLFRRTYRCDNTRLRGRMLLDRYSTVTFPLHPLHPFKHSSPGYSGVLGRC